MKKKKMIKKLLKLYKKEYDAYQKAEPESAQSGEWEDYNVSYIAKAEAVYMLQSILTELKIDYSHIGE